MGRVHRVARELEDGMQRWQDRIMLMQYEQLRKARENAALYTDSKKLRAEIDNKRRALEHSTKIQRRVCVCFLFLKNYVVTTNNTVNSLIYVI